MVSLWALWQSYQFRFVSAEMAEKFWFNPHTKPKDPIITFHSKFVPFFTKSQILTEIQDFIRNGTNQKILFKTARQDKEEEEEEILLLLHFFPFSLLLVEKRKGKKNEK